MKRKLILSLAFMLTLTGGINVSIKKNYASDNEITELTKNLTETANKIIPNSSLIKYVNDTLVFFNGEQVTDLSIYNYNNSTYLPLRAIGDLLGAKVNWFAEDMVAQVSLDNTQIEVLNNTNTVVVKKDDNIEESKITATSNGQSVDLPALNIGGNIYLPLRYISETLGVNIDYTVNHEKTGVKTIEIYKGNKPELNYVRDIPLSPVMVESTGNYWGYFGFIDNTGKLVIPRIENMEMILPPYFSEGLAIVHNTSYSKKYFINKNGELAFPYGFESVGPFSEGLAAVQDEETNKWGYIDKTGKLVIPYQFNLVGDFKEGLARVNGGKEFDNNWGYIDKTGKLVIPYQYDEAENFSEGLALVEIRNSIYNAEQPDAPQIDIKRKYIDKTGKEVIPYNPNLVYKSSFKNGVAIVSKSNTYIRADMGAIDKTGKIVIPCEYEILSGLKPNSYINEGLIIVRNEESKHGYINTSGKLVIPFMFDTASPFSEGLARVGKNGPGEPNASEHGYIDKTGKMVIPYIKSSYAGDFENGLATISPEEGGSYYINKTGKKISNTYIGK